MMKIKNICCIGAGYVGGPTMAVIALKCPQIKVTVVDKNQDKIKAWNTKNLNSLPVFEPGLKDIIKKVRDKNLFFSSDMKSAIDKSEMIFLAVNTPTKLSGEGKGMAADLKNIESSAKEIAKFSNNDKIVVEKSTLPVRTAEKLKQILSSSNNQVNFEVLSNPEFLAEGTAIKDLFKSDRVLVGGDQTRSGKKAIRSLVKIYENWIPKSKILTSNVWSAELSKLASNAMLAQRISSINSLSAFCQKTGADILEVSRAVGADKRIGNKFLQPSVGFGGSCFQKDILNLVYLSKYYGLETVAEYWHQVLKINNYQRERFVNILVEHLGKSLSSKRIAILGWAFKKDTNDSRESSSIYVSEMLLDKGANLTIYDPRVSKEKILSDLNERIRLKNKTQKHIDSIINRVKICDSIDECCRKINAAAILTEWDSFKKIKWNKKQFIAPHLIVDGRMIINKKNISKEINLITI